MLDFLMAGSSSDGAFWLMVLGVGALAALFGLKLILHAPHEAPRHGRRPDRG